MRSRVLLCLLSFSVTVFGAAAASAQPGIPPIVTQAAQVAAVTTAGVIVHQRHMSVTAVLGPAHFSNTNDAVLLLSDGAYRHIHFLRMTENGKVLSPAQVAKREDDYNKQLEKGEGFFKQPFDRKYLSDYTYVAQKTSGGGDVGVIFESALHDEQHGSGEMLIDPSTGRVTSVVYTPYVFPDHANAGTVTETFGEPAPGLWTIVRIDKNFTGRMMLVSGHGTSSETLDNFHRFTDADAGLAFYHSAEQ